MKHMHDLSHVVDWRLCVGCGVCAYVCPENRVRLVDFAREGIRPVLEASDCKACTLCLDVCPGVETDFLADRLAAEGAAPKPTDADEDFTRHWGPVLEVWEGHAADPLVRFKGSSGGILTALATYCVESAGMHGVLHTGYDPDDPVRNRTRLSRTKSDLVKATGSRYAPASVGNGLALVEQAPAPCAIIGQPSDIAGVNKARRLRLGLDAKIGVTMSFFCAGSPPTGATTALLDRHKIKPSTVAELHYRGQGWPGHFAATVDGQPNPAVKLTYRESWAFLQAFRPWAVQLWPDGSGELADISCGDPWYFEPDGINPGSSLVLVRTERGRAILRGAIEAGYVQLTRAEAWKVEKSQAGLWQKKGSVWGRQLALRVFGVPTTKISGAFLWECWKALSVNEKLRSTFGTLRRIVGRRLYRRARYRMEDGVPVPPAIAADALFKK